MHKNKSAKRSLLLSALSLLLCMAMLVGTTFAWFTDSVTSGKNKIVAGNLDVELEYAKVVDGNLQDWATVEDKDAIFNPNALWEPGRVEVVYLKVSNLGTLALKYQLGVNVLGETPSVSVKTDKEFKLSDYLVFKTVEMPDALTTYTDREAAQVAAGTEMGLKDYNSKTTTLEVGGTDYVALIVYMPESVGNEANYKKDAPVPTIELGVNLFATQVEAESDSYGDDYDKNAWHDAFKVQSAEELQTAINAGKTEIMLTADIEASEAIVIPAGANVALNLVGHTVSGNIAKDTGAVLVNNGTLTLVGGEVDSTAANGAAAIDNNGTMTLKGVKITGAPITAGGHPEYAIQTSGTLMIEEGTSVSSDRGAISIDGDGSTTINGGVFTANDINQTLTSHVVDLDSDIPGEHILTINGGTFQHLYERTSGGVVICNRTKNTVYVNGGNFSGGNYYGNDNLSDYGYGGTFSVKGGTFDAKPAAKYIATGYVTIDNGDGTYTVLPTGMSAVSGYSHLYTDGANGYYVYDVQGLQSLNNWINMWNPFGNTFNVMADINASGYTWTCKNLSPNGDNTPGFTFNGNGHTISNLTVADGGLFSLATNGTYAAESTTFKDITFDYVTVTGGYHTGVVWSQVAGDLVLDNVHVKNSSITGDYNVGGLVGSTGEFAIDASVKYVDCSVTNTTITANGAAGGDPTGASAFIGRALGKTSLVFEGDNVTENITYVNENGLVGGGIYGYTIWADGGFAGTGTCDTFTNWNGISAAAAGTTLQDAIANSNGASQVVMPAGNYGMPGTSGNVTISGTKDTVITVSGTPAGSNVTFDGVTVKGSGYSTGMNAATVTYNNATIVGEMCLYREKVVFNNCTFNLAAGQYIWTYGAAEVEFNNCTFNTAGKAILIYNEGDGASTVTVKGCTFNATAGATAGDLSNQNCAAIEINNWQSNGSTSHTLITEDNTVDEDFSGEWRIKKYVASEVITVNGVTYTQPALDGTLLNVVDNKVQ